MSFIDIIDEHPEATIGIVLVVVLFAAGALINKSTTAASTTTTTASDTSGLQTDASGNKIVYVPTSTSFSTYNVGSQNNTNTGNTTTSTTTTTPAPVVITPTVPAPVTKPVVTPTPTPTHTPAPTPAPKYGLLWGAKHIVTTDDTNQGTGALAHIASQSTSIMRTQQHAPSSVTVTAANLVTHNPGLRTNSLLKLGSTVIVPSYGRIS